MTSQKPLIHFAHANGVPSRVYQQLFDQLKDEYDIIYVPLIGPDRRYPISSNWPHLVDQIVDSIVQQSQGRKVIGLGHSLGSVLTFMASCSRPELFSQVIMLDPPLILGKASFIFQMAKLFSPKMVDRITPAGLSIRRRDHWESRQQAYALLRNKGFYQHFDEACFQAYIDYALSHDPARGGVTLTIPRADEVAIFRTNPSLWWLPMPGPRVPIHLMTGDQSPFYQKGFPQIAKRKLGIAFSVTEGGHMFPLERPVQVAELIRHRIREQAG
ncbi:alpha/beta fold hydrolase [Acinetobacter sp. WZC-1]|uniref:alpha/beta fold hydrolase n=1 Tax=Acinetobacter sp. WZC-1 TaxID=3459034 RepID=UPI00403D57DC